MGVSKQGDEGKTLQWSVYFQNPAFLERTRMFLIMEELRPLVRAWCGLRDGMRILDVGCGTGYFSRLLAEGPEDVSVVGVDLEEPYIEYARSQQGVGGQACEFMVADAHALPFEDNSFDLVASHTFLTSAPEPDQVMDEMLRVARPGALIASVTAMNFMAHGYHLGFYPDDCAWVSEYRKMEHKFTLIYNAIDPLQSRVPGVATELVPHFFVEHGLERVSAYPLGKMFCLSNAAVSESDKLRWIDLCEQSETMKLDAFSGLVQFWQHVSHEEVARYREVLRERCAWLREHVNDNEAWDWQGGANILVCGTVPQSA